MLLKRKRSEDELSCFSSGGIGYSSPMRSDHGDVVMMDTDTCSPVSPSHPAAAFSPGMQSRSRSCTPSHLPSRTFKRLRNGRPSDQEVHRKLLATWALEHPPSFHTGILAYRSGTFSREHSQDAVSSSAAALPAAPRLLSARLDRVNSLHAATPGTSSAEPAIAAQLLETTNPSA